MDTLTFIGTATTVLRLGEFTLLTDPNFLHRGSAPTSARGCGRVASPSRPCGLISSRRWTLSCSHTCTATTSTGSPAVS